MSQRLLKSKNWIEYKFGDLATFKNGTNYKAHDKGHEVTFLGVGDFKGNSSLADSKSLGSIELKDKPSIEGLLRYGDLVFVRSNGSKSLVGRCLNVKFDPENLIYSGFCIRARLTSKKTFSDYINLLIQLGVLKRKLAKEGGGTNITNLNQKILHDLRFNLPSLPEQKAIADVLSTWDQAIEKTQQLIKAKERQFDWMQDDIFESLNKSGACKTLRLNEVCKVTKGKQLNKEHMVPEGVYDVLNGGVSASGKTQTWNTEANTISISEGGNSCGFVNYNPQKFWAGGHCYVLTDILSSVYSQYLYFHLKHRERLIMRLRVGSGLPNIQKKDIEHFSVVIPTRDEQFTVIEKLSTAQAEITVLKKLLTQYQTQKRGLMQRLLTGEWRVNLTK